MRKPLSGFSPEVFARRRTLAFQGLEGGAMVLPSARALFRSRDTEVRYRPDPELFYLTGCSDPEVVAVLLDTDSEDRFILFMPPPDPAAAIWTGPRLGLEEARERFGADAVHPLEELGDRLPELLREATGIHFRLGVHAALETLIVAALQTARLRGPRRGEGPRRIVDPGEILDDLRLVKEPEEIVRIREVTKITVDAFKEAIGGTRPGMGEWEIEARLESAFRRSGGWGPAFPTIVGSGANGCILHYTENGRTLHGDELVLLDGGAEAALYTGDITRTYPCSGRFSEEQRAVYEAVERAHAAALAAARPGARMTDLHQAVLRELTQSLVAFELLRGDVEELISEEAYKPYFPHQTSHWLGLDVHDVGDYVRGEASRILEPGMVLTIEPGLYLSDLDAGADHSLAGIGVRIEDDLLVTETGVENLTASLPVAPEEVQELVGTD